MRLGRHVFLILFAVAAVFLFLSAYKEVAVENPGAAGITKLSGQPEETPAQRMASLVEKIKEFERNLKKHFADGNFDAIANLLGEDARIVTPEYKKIQGKDKVKNFWKEKKEKAEREMEQGQVELKLKTANIFMSDEIGPWKVIKDGEEVTYNSVASVVTEIRIVVKKSGETVKNDTFYATITYLHRLGCPWDP